MDTSAILIERYDPAGCGPTVAVKDCIDIAGTATRCGSRAFEDAPVAPANAKVVQCLIDAGYRIVGKAGMHELAYGMTGLNDWTGHVPNPLYPSLIPGGSSSGSAAAVAAGLADIALGTDTGGSVRMPAACCGIVGFKPSFGRLSRDGVLPRETSLDCVGLLAGSVAQVEATMTYLDPTFMIDGQDRPGGPAVRIGTVEVVSNPLIEAAIAAVLAAQDASCDPCALPLLDAAYDAGMTQIAAEAHAAYGHLTGSGRLGTDIEKRLRAAPGLASAQDLTTAAIVREAFTAQVDDLLERYDVLALPTLPQFPPRICDVGDPVAVARLSRFVRPFNLSGHPAISIPVPARSPHPAAIQLVARHGDDARLCAIARMIEQASASLRQGEQP